MECKYEKTKDFAFSKLTFKVPEKVEKESTCSLRLL